MRPGSLAIARRRTGFSAQRYVWGFGDPAWAYNTQISGTPSPGWTYNGNFIGAYSSTGWVRDASGQNAITPTRVYYDDTAFPDLMSGITASRGVVGFPSPASGPLKTIAVRVDHDDPAVPGITLTSQGAVLRLTHPDDVNSDYGPRPPVSPLQGETWYFGYAFATNPGYKPYGWDASDLTWGDFNGCGLEIHGSDGYDVLGPILPNISTIWPANAAERIAGPNGSVWWKRMGNASSFISAAGRLGFDLTGGLTSVGATDNSTNTCRGFVGPTLVTGQRYKVIFQVKFDAFQAGFIKWWVDSGDGNGYVLYADQTNVSTMWRNATGPDPFMYPQMLNYRKYSSTITSNIFYYAGYVRGSTFADVVVP